MKTFKIGLLAVVAVLFAACYNDFDTPAPAPIYTDTQAEADAAGPGHYPFSDVSKGATRLTIAEVKGIFIDKFGSLSNTGNNSSWSDTKYYQFEENVYLKGKVISDDEEGNIFKSLFLQDESGAIEIKLTNGNYLKYHMGQYIYVLLKDLFIGNYRMMLSIGNGPTDSYNAVGEHKFYANSNIELPWQIEAHVFPGLQSTLEVGVDIKVVNETNYTELTQADFGRLIRFENIECHYAGVDTQEKLYPEQFPDYEMPAPLKNGSFEQIYPSWIYTDIRPIVNKAWYKMAFSNAGTNLYGSVCFRYNKSAEYTSDKGVYMVRTSGYSRFAGRPVVKDGAVGTITGIYGIYSKSSNFTGGDRDFATYQLSLNRFSDLDFKTTDFLTLEEVAALTPNDSYITPDVDDPDDL